MRLICALKRKKISKNMPNSIKSDRLLDNSRKQTEEFLDSIEQINFSGAKILLGRVYDDMGFNKIEDEYFSWLVLARRSFPASKSIKN